MTESLPDLFHMSSLPTPIGEARIVYDGEGRLRAFDWTTHLERMERLLRRHYGSAAAPARRIETAAPRVIADRFGAYFAGEIDALATLSWATGGTVFQQTVWGALQDIAPGETWSYGQLAAHIGAPRAVRAVGLANGANPVALVVPCHRVIGANGTLTGYGGGLERKRWLLAHERASPALGAGGDRSGPARL